MDHESGVLLVMYPWGPLLGPHWFNTVDKYIFEYLEESLDEISSFL